MLYVDHVKYYTLCLWQQCWKIQDKQEVLPSLMLLLQENVLCKSTAGQ